MGPPVSHVMFFASKDVSWSPSELSTGGIENIPKCTRLKIIPAPQSRLLDLAGRRLALA